MLSLFAWVELLKIDSGPLQIHLLMILLFGAQLSYKDSEFFILSKNQALPLVNIEIIDKKLVDYLRISKMKEVLNLIFSFIFSSVGFVSKHNVGRRKIYHFFYLIRHSLNNQITDCIQVMRYARLQNVLHLVIWDRKNCIIFKRNIKDVFKNILVVPHQRWLLGFI